MASDYAEDERSDGPTLQTDRVARYPRRSSWLSQLKVGGGIYQPYMAQSRYYLYTCESAVETDGANGDVRNDTGARLHNGAIDGLRDSGPGVASWWLSSYLTRAHLNYYASIE